MKMWYKSLDRENEVKVKWHLLDWHLHFTMYLLTKYSWSVSYSNWETDLLMKMWRKSLYHENEVKFKWHLADWHVHLTKYLQNRYRWSISNSNWETDLLMKMRCKFDGHWTVTRFTLGSHICWPNGTKRRRFIEDLT